MAEDELLNFGWVHDPDQVARFLATLVRPTFRSAAPGLMGSGADQEVLLYKALKDVNGSYPPYPRQTIGDCFVAGTMVLGERSKPIEDIDVGDRVWTADGKLTDVVSKKKSRNSKPLSRIDSAGVRPIVCTADHRFLVRRCKTESRFWDCKPEWVAASKLEETDHLISPLGKLTFSSSDEWSIRCDSRFAYSQVKSVDTTDSQAIVYDIGVADDQHSFLANGVAAHNCVSHGFGHGIDLLSCVEIALAGQAEEFHQTATEAVYGMARVDIGGQRGSYEDGAVGAWAAKAVSQIGTLDRNTLGPYDGKRAKEWGARGVPDEYKRLAPKHQVKTVALVQTWEELIAAIANGYPVPVCSNQGFTMTRDQDGFCSPKGQWAHCLMIAGVRAGSRPGACIFQSWGENVPDGPTSLDQPNYSFWADREVVKRMLAMQDTWAISNFDGYPGQTLPSHWTYAGFA